MDDEGRRRRGGGTLLSVDEAIIISCSLVLVRDREAAAAGLHELELAKINWHTEAGPMSICDDYGPLHGPRRQRVLFRLTSRTR